MSNFKINFGDPHEEFVLPTMQECLLAHDASLYSAQNAVRIHEWLGDASAVSLLLKKVDTGEEVELNTTTSYTRLANKYLLEVGGYIFLSRAMLTMSVISLHQIALALPELIEYDQRADNTLERNGYIQDNLRVMAANTATAIFHNTHLPKKLVYLNEDVLPLVIAATMTQRGKLKYVPKAVVNGRPPSTAEEVKIRLAFNHHLAMVTRNHFDDPQVVANANSNYFTINELQQVAMAMSVVFGYMFPLPYYADTEGNIYKESVTYFNQVKDELYSFKPLVQIRSHLRSVK